MKKNKENYDEREALNSSNLYLRIASGYVQSIRDRCEELKAEDLTMRDMENIFESLDFSFKHGKECFDLSLKLIKRVRKEKRRASLISRIKKTIQIWKR